MFWPINGVWPGLKPQQKVEMIHTTYHRRIWFWLSKQQQALGPASQKLLEYLRDKLTMLHSHISRESYIISSALLKEQCEVIHQLAYSETIGGRPIKLVLFIKSVCSFIANSSHYFGRYRMNRKSHAKYTRKFSVKKISEWRILMLNIGEFQVFTTESRHVDHSLLEYCTMQSRRYRPMFCTSVVRNKDWCFQARVYNSWCTGLIT
jgi:hypothetical protein